MGEGKGSKRCNSEEDIHCICTCTCMYMYVLYTIL